jgi:osmoprotectant transport system permease protein
MGMTRNQRLWLVEAPLVAPVLMAGVRTAAVWTIGAATLSTTVGQPSLGDLIFAGLQTQNWTLVLAGCFAAAGLALTADALLGLVEYGIARRRRGLVWASLGALLLGLLAALAPAWPAAKGVVTIGAKGFSEQYILIRVIGHRLEAAGYRVRYREGLGSAVAFTALAGGDIDVLVDYSGTVWANQMKRSDVPSREAIVAGVGQWVKAQHQITMLGSLGFENTYAFAMRGNAAARRGIESLDDLARQADQLAFATDPEFLERPEWASVRRAYGIAFASARPYQPTFMYRALASGAADVISAYSSDGRIAADKLKVLRDPRGAIPGYDAILLIAPGRANDAKFQGVLKGLIGAISVERMREANYMVDRDAGKVTPGAAAKWLEKAIAR